MIDVLVIGTGEYVTGLSGSKTTSSDKDLGVVALCLFDLRLRGFISRITLCGRNPKRQASVLNHIQHGIGSRFRDLDIGFDYHPPTGDQPDPTSYLKAMQNLRPGSAVIVVTPDDTHFDIAKAALEHGHHILVAKPLVKTVFEHKKLIDLAANRGLLGMVEFHKRYDPIYRDAVNRAAFLGNFGYMFSFMSQPKSQLTTFGEWAGAASDISYYLNSHHIDILCQMVGGRYKPLTVHATNSSGEGQLIVGRPIDDTITLTVKWQCLTSESLAHSVHTASWTAPRSDAHSHQRFLYLAAGGQIEVDQARRGYTLSTDSEGLRNINPLFMNYTPRDGRFVGQDGYGYRSIESFISRVSELAQNKTSLQSINATTLPTLENTLATTAVLQAGHQSLLSGLPIAVEI